MPLLPTSFLPLNVTPLQISNCFIRNELVSANHLELGQVVQTQRDFRSFVPREERPYALHSTL